MGVVFILQELSGARSWVPFQQGAPVVLSSPASWGQNLREGWGRTVAPEQLLRKNFLSHQQSCEYQRQGAVVIRAQGLSPAVFHRSIALETLFSF